MLVCSVLYTFQPGSRTPPEVKWEGILEWKDEQDPSPSGHTRVLKLQCGLRVGQNGPFLTMPYVRKQDPTTGRTVAARGADGKYRNYADVGWRFQQTGVDAVRAHIQSGGFASVGVSPTANQWDQPAPQPRQPINATPPQERIPGTVTQAEGDALLAAQQAFPGATLGPVTSEADDPFGDLPW